MYTPPAAASARIGIGKRILELIRIAAFIAAFSVPLIVAAAADRHDGHRLRVGADLQLPAHSNVAISSNTSSSAWAASRSTVTVNRDGPAGGMTSFKWMDRRDRLVIEPQRGAMNSKELEGPAEPSASASSAAFASASGGMRVTPTILGGIRKNEYTSGHTLDSQDGRDVWWIKAKQKASRDRAYHATLTQEIAAEPYWNQRIMFEGEVGWRGLSRNNNGFGSLMARVVSGYGQTLALDNMQGRALVGWNYQRQRLAVVLDVPGPPSAGSCPEVATLPAFIYLGLMLNGGVGYMDIRDATFTVVGLDVPVTNGMPKILF